MGRGCRGHRGEKGIAVLRTVWSEVLDGERDGPQAVCPEEE